VLVDLTLEDIARSSFAGFSGYVDPTWAPFPHVRLVAEALEDVESGKIQKLMVFLPGQHGKSTLVSRNFPAWYLGRNPDRAMILASYGASYAALWGRRARDVVQRFGPALFGVDVRRDSSAADHWELQDHRGVMHTAGVDGPITGHSADVVVIDDPVKSREEAESQTMRDKTVEWYKSSVVSRRPKSQILLMTRWHEQDLAGWLLETEPGEWTVISLPALAKVGDALGRAPGEALCPAFLTREKLLQVQRTVGSYVWASMWDQTPTPIGGGMFKPKHARRYRLDGDEYVVRDDGTTFTAAQCDRFLTVDTATSEEKKNCQTAISSWAVDPRGRLVLLDVDMDWLEAPEIMRRVASMCAKWNTVAWIEENSTSKHLLQFMESQHVVFRLLKPGSRSKFTRALPASAMWEQGQILFPEVAEWSSPVERQLFHFSGADSDDADFVDTLAYAARVVLEEIRSGSGSGLQPMSSDSRPKQYLPSGISASGRPPGFERR